MAVFIQKIYIVGKNFYNFLSFPSRFSLSLHIRLNNIFNSSHNTGFSLNACRKNAFLRVQMNNRSVAHGKGCGEFGMLAALRHRHHNLLLLIHLRNSIPGSLRPIIIVRHRIRFQRFAVNGHRLDGITDLVLDAEN